MSVLYQALKRRDEVERTGAPGAGVYTPLPERRTGMWPFILTLLILLVSGAYAYIFLSNTAAPIIMPPPAPVATTVTPPPSPAMLTDNMAATPITDAAQIAALMPEGAQVPLPLPPVQVGKDASPLALQQRARTLQMQGASDAALRLYKQNGDDFASRINRWGLVAETEPATALPHLQKLVREQPENAAARAQLGLANIKLNQLDAARAELLTASALAPTNAQIWYNLAALTDQMGDSEVAQNAYQQALLHAGDAPPFDKASVQRRLNYLRGR